MIYSPHYIDDDLIWLTLLTILNTIEGALNELYRERETLDTMQGVSYTIQVPF